jgi:hypothetical protein
VDEKFRGLFSDVTCALGPGIYELHKTIKQMVVVIQECINTNIYVYIYIYIYIRERKFYLYSLLSKVNS